MAYRNVVISSAVRITVKNEQLEISGEISGSVPIEDIRTLVLESRASTISTYALSLLAQRGVCVYLCDEQHLPCAVIAPFCQNSRQKKQIELPSGESPYYREMREFVECVIENKPFPTADVSSVYETMRLIFREKYGE